MSSAADAASGSAGASGASDSLPAASAVPVAAAAATAARASKTSKVFYFIRHGESEANVHFYAGRIAEARALRDPPLSSLGQQQAANTASDEVLAEALAASPENVLVCISPLRRTIQTALGAVGDWVASAKAKANPNLASADANVSATTATANPSSSGTSVAARTGTSDSATTAPPRVVFCPDIQETGEVDCDTGSPVGVMQDEFGEAHSWLPFDTLPADWWEKKALYQDTGVCLAARLTKFLEWARAQPQQHVIVVAHHNVFLALVGITFKNCEVRAYTLAAECELPAWGRRQQSIPGAALAQFTPGGESEAEVADTTPTVQPDPAAAAVFPLGPTVLVPHKPLPSTSEADLSDEDRKWLGNAAMIAHNQTKMTAWGFAIPERLR